MTDKIQKWRRDFDLKAELGPAINMFKEEVEELLRAIDGDGDIASEFADVLFVTEQLREALNIDAEAAVNRVLARNYTKRMTLEEFRVFYPTVCPYEVKIRDGYVYLYQDGKLQKPPTFK